MRERCFRQGYHRRSVVADVLEPRLHFSATAAFDYSMPDRFGIDANNGRVDLLDTAAYADPSTFTVNLDGTLSKAGSKIVQFSWAVPTATGKGVMNLSGATQSIQLPLGTYPMSLTVKDAGGASSTVTKQIAVKDILFVSIGDSYASGQGAPDGSLSSPGGIWAQGTPDTTTKTGTIIRGTTYANALAHRSTYSAPAQAAIAIEDADPHTSVTFVSFAEAGATVADLDSELASVKQVIGNRSIDILTVSVGGNDVGFSDIIAGLEENRNEFGLDLEDPYFKAEDAVLPGEFATLANNFKNVLGQELRALPVPPSDVYITEYPDPTFDQTGHQPALQATDLIYPALTPGIDSREAAWASQNFVAPLNATILTAAKLEGWNYVGQISSDFATHGYPATVGGWIQTGTGAYVDGEGPDGAYHPNRVGYADIATRILGSIYGLSSRVVASDGSVYCLYKNGELVVFNTEGVLSLVSMPGQVVTSFSLSSNALDVYWRNSLGQTWEDADGVITRISQET